MSMYDDLGEEMGVQQQGGGFINLKPGAEPTIAKFLKLESAECTDKEKEPSQYNQQQFAFCRPNGKTFVYTFESPVDNTVQIMRSHKNAIFWAFSNENVLPGETIKLRREGSGQKDTRYIIDRPSDEEVAEYVAQRKADIEAGDQAMAPIAEPAPEMQNEENVNIDDIPW